MTDCPAPTDTAARIERIARCEEEIRRLEDQPEDIPDRAYLVCMGVEDWRAELRLEVAEMENEIVTMAEYCIARVKAQLDLTAGERELKPRESDLLELLTPLVEEYEARPSERAKCQMSHTTTVTGPTA